MIVTICHHSSITEPVSTVSWIILCAYPEYLYLIVGTRGTRRNKKSILKIYFKNLLVLQDEGAEVCYIIYQERGCVVRYRAAAVNTLRYIW